MPKILSYTPPWLSRPSSGSEIFSDVPPPPSSKRIAASTGSDAAYHGPHRIVAKRGSEIFFVAGNQIRWGDLRGYKNIWEEGRGRGGAQAQNAASSQSYRVLNVPVYERITQLIPSPSGEFLAILTIHTVHIATLPSPSRLKDQDDSPLKLKTYQLGPTTHVIPQSEVVSALWHPLGVSSPTRDCLVTVTADAAVRIWELDRDNLWSFDRPALAIDLVKLIDGTSCDENFEPAGFGKSKGFSADAFDMEVASACFGGSGADDEHGWASMTLWVAMKTGDVYALCPLLPSRWQPSGTMIPSLSTAVVSKVSSTALDTSVTADEDRIAGQQFSWVRALDVEDPFTTLDRSEGGSTNEVYTRPVNPSAIPRVQGPFQCEGLDELEDAELTDIHVIAAKIDAEDLLSGEDDDYPDVDAMSANGLSATIICLTTDTGRVYICLDLAGVEGQWLPQTKKAAFSMPRFDPREILLAEILETVESSQMTETTWPTFTQDANSRYSFFLTTTTNVTFFSLEDWADQLNQELSAPDTEGVSLRLKAFSEGPLAVREQILPARSDPDLRPSQEHFSSSLVFQDPDIGYFLLTCTSEQPYAAFFDAPSGLASSYLPSPPLLLGPPEDYEQGLLPAPARSPYQPPGVFYAQPSLEALQKSIPARHRQMLQQEIRLSPQTLDVMTTAHRLLSSQTHALERSAADLFRRCERLQNELQDQMRQMAALAQKVKQREQGPNAKPSERMKAVKEKQKELLERYEAVRKKLGREHGGRELSKKEMAWVGEIERLSQALGVEGPEAEGEEERLGEARLKKRYETLKSIAEDLLAQTRDEPSQPSQSDTHPQPSRPLPTSALSQSLLPINPKSAHPTARPLPASARPTPTSALSQSQLPINPKSAHPTTTARPTSSSSATGPNRRNSDVRIPPRLQKAKLDETFERLSREDAVIEAMTARLARLNTSVASGTT